MFQSIEYNVLKIRNNVRYQAYNYVKYYFMLCTDPKINPKINF